MPHYRMLDSATGETIWQGRAHDVSDAEERCFYFDQPGSLERFTLQRWGTVHYSRELRGKGWVTVYENRHLCPV